MILDTFLYWVSASQPRYAQSARSYPARKLSSARTGIQCASNVLGKLWGMGVQTAASHSVNVLFEIIVRRLFWMRSSLIARVRLQGVKEEFRITRLTAFLGGYIFLKWFLLIFFIFLFIFFLKHGSNCIHQPSSSDNWNIICHKIGIPDCALEITNFWRHLEDDHNFIIMEIKELLTNPTF